MDSTSICPIYPCISSYGLNIKIAFSDEIVVGDACMLLIWSHIINHRVIFPERGMSTASMNRGVKRWCTRRTRMANDYL